MFVPPGAERKGLVRRVAKKGLTAEGVDVDEADHDNIWESEIDNCDRRELDECLFRSLFQNKNNEKQKERARLTRNHAVIHTGSSVTQTFVL